MVAGSSAESSDITVSISGKKAKMDEMTRVVNTGGRVDKHLAELARRVLALEEKDTEPKDKAKEKEKVIKPKRQSREFSTSDDDDATTHSESGRKDEWKRLATSIQPAPTCISSSDEQSRWTNQNPKVLTLPTFTQHSEAKHALDLTMDSPTLEKKSSKTRWTSSAKARLSHLNPSRRTSFVH